MYVKKKYMLQYSWNTHTGTEGNVKGSAPCVYVNNIYVYIYIRTYIYILHTPARKATLKAARQPSSPSFLADTVVRALEKTATIMPM